MQVKRDAEGNLLVFYPVYEREAQIAEMNFLIRQVEKIDGDATQFVAVLGDIKSTTVRVQ